MISIVGIERYIELKLSLELVSAEDDNDEENDLSEDNDDDDLKGNFIRLLGKKGYIRRLRNIDPFALENP